MPVPVRPRYLPLPYQDSAESGRLILRDGSTAQLRLATPADVQAVRAFFDRLSPDATRRRFFSATRPGDAIVAEMCGSTDPRSACHLLVFRTHDGEPRVVAVGSYVATRPGTAEVALAVDDDFRGKGLGTLLLERLALVAVRNGFTRFWAVTHTDNRAMLGVFRDSGFAVAEWADGGEVEVDLAVVPTATAVEQLETRDRVATVASLVPFFRPNAVAVVGASRDPNAIGSRVLDALVKNRFAGPVYPVNPKTAEIAGQRAYPSVRDLPQQVDLAVIVVPQSAVLGVVDDCAARGVRALVVITAGFAEDGLAGRELQAKLVEKVRGHGMRMVGPNCMGLLNADVAVRLAATFSPVFPPPGRVAMSSQSGAVGLAALGSAGRLGLGFSTFVSVGNKADVSGNDLLQYWEDDPGTDVILLYLESFGNPRRFARIARRVGLRKPVVVLKSGRTTAGGRAAGSHTAALAGSTAAVDALFRQTGVVRADTLGEMLDLALALGSQPLPTGRRVGVVTNAGGPGILCTDACEAAGLTVPELSVGLRARLAELVPGAASTGNPIDLIAAAGPEQFRRSVAAVLASGEVDALVAIYIPVGLADTDAVIRALGEAVAEAERASGDRRPVLACLMTSQEARSGLGDGSHRIPCYPYPETPGYVLGRIAEYAEWRARPPGVVPDFDDLDLAAARAVCHKALAERGAGWLSADDVQALFTAVRLPLVVGGVAKSAHEAVELATRIGYPVAVKLASRRLVHKTDVGGVHLHLAEAAAVWRAFDTIRANLEAAGQGDAFEGVVVQPMLRGGVEVLVGVTQDPLFGPLIAFGLGGVHVEVLRDVAFSVAPLTDRGAAELVRGIRGLPLLRGHRGAPPCDLGAIEEVLLRVSRLAEEVPEIGEIDMNPVFALPEGQGCRIADARVSVRTAR